jgi:DnaJ-domain-containing protein 1
MNVFERFIRVIIARINSASDDHTFADNDFSGSNYRDYAKHSGQGQTQDNGPASVDPKIAEYYANLEIPFGSDLKAVKSAWKRLMRKYHPDIHSKDKKKQELAKELTQRLNRAYEELTNYLNNNISN